MKPGDDVLARLAAWLQPAGPDLEHERRVSVQVLTSPGAFLVRLELALNYTDRGASRSCSARTLRTPSETLSLTRYAAMFAWGPDTPAGVTRGTYGKAPNLGQALAAALDAWELDAVNPGRSAQDGPGPWGAVR